MALRCKVGRPLVERTLAGARGDNPDRAWLEGIGDHHQPAVDTSQVAVQKGLREEVRDFAEDVIQMRADEINDYWGELEEHFGL